MNAQNAYQYLPLLHAFLEGKQLEFESTKGWIPCTSVCSLKPIAKYRIKPEEPRLFEMWRNTLTGNMFCEKPSDDQFRSWEIIKLKEVQA